MGKGARLKIERKSKKEEALLLNRSMFEQTLIEAKDALNELYGFGPERNKRFEDKLREKHREYAAMIVADSKADADITYTMSVLDRIDQRVSGKYARPFEERINYSE